MVLREALRPALAGIAVGMPLAFGAAWVLRSMLYGVSPGDVQWLLVAAAVILGASGLAAWIPARRAARVDPMEALRAD